MYFDIGEAATGSSTSALAYIFMPIYVFIFGVIVFLVSKLIRALFGKFKPNKAIKWRTHNSWLCSFLAILANYYLAAYGGVMYVERCGEYLNEC